MSGAADAQRAERAKELLAALDQATTLPLLSAGDPPFGLAEAFAVAETTRRLRRARGEVPLGYKIGFTNRGIWARYGVFAPIWGPVWEQTVEFADDAQAKVSLTPFVQPRLEPEIMFGFARPPVAGASTAELARCIDWIAHGFEIVHTHFANWRFAAADTVADFALHGRLVVGPRLPLVGFGARDGEDLAAQLAALRVTLSCDGRDVEEGRADIVLGGPLDALRLWVDAMAAQTPGWTVRAGDIVTTGTITDAAPLAAGQCWQTRLSDPRFAGMTLRTLP